MILTQQITLISLLLPTKLYNIYMPILFPNGISLTKSQLEELSDQFGYASEIYNPETNKQEPNKLTKEKWAERRVLRLIEKQFGNIRMEKIKTDGILLD